MKRQSLNVYRMNLFGAKVTGVASGTATLKDAINEAFRDWVSNIDTTFYCIGCVMGPHPYPTMVRDFQKVISAEIKAQLMEKEGRLPDCVVACVGFYQEDKSSSLLVQRQQAEASPDHFAKGSLGIFHGMKSLFFWSVPCLFYLSRS